MRVFGVYYTIGDPCNSNPCPSGTKYCWRNFSDDLGRWCYNANWVVMWLRIRISILLLEPLNRGCQQ